MRDQVMTLTEHAYTLGSFDRYCDRPPLDLDNGQSAELMARLDLHPTPANAAIRDAACDAYLDGWHAANSALGGYHVIPRI